MCSNEYFWLFWRGWTGNYCPGNARPYAALFTDSRACLKFTGLGMLARVRFFSPTLVRAREVNRCWNARPGAVVITDFCACPLATPGSSSQCCRCRRVVAVVLSLSRCCRHVLVFAFSSSRCCRRVFVVALSSSCFCCRFVVVTLLLSQCVVMVPSKVLQQSFLLFDVKRCCSNSVFFSIMVPLPYIYFSYVHMYFFWYRSLITPKNVQTYVGKINVFVSMYWNCALKKMY